MVNKEFSIGIEYYKSEEETSTDSGLYNEFDGVKLASYTVEPKEAVEYAQRFIKKIINASPGFIKATFPRLYNISCTKQFWFHVFEKDVVVKNQIPKEDDEIKFDEATIEESLEQIDSPILNMIDVYFDKDGDEIYNPPERISFWDTL